MADVLIVDDDPGVAELLAVVLEREGHHVRVSPDGQHGLESLRAAVPDLLFVDVNMPRLDGPHLLAQVAAEGLGAGRMRVVLMSGGADPSGVAARVGAVHVLVKPFTVAAALAVTGRALANGRAYEPKG
jgi:CheY-like chemotaxis protein